MKNGICAAAAMAVFLFSGVSFSGAEEYWYPIYVIEAPNYVRAVAVRDLSQVFAGTDNQGTLFKCRDIVMMSAFWDPVCTPAGAHVSNIEFRNLNCVFIFS